MEHIQIPGSSGSLEAILDLPEGTQRCAVICHPHPLYGGNLHDNLVSILSGACLSMGIGTLRFNFRGVGQSEGSHDKGAGEVNDIVSVVEWLRVEKGITSIILGGYSFGAVVALKAIGQVSPEQIILVAPPVGMMDTSVEPGGTLGGEEQPDAQMLVILGDRDDIVEHNSTLSFFTDAKVHSIKGADHFFASASAEIQQAVREFVHGT
ncbi:MAG: alpha/beta fold hydrolase [Pseudomonadales bacterium]